MSMSNTTKRVKEIHRNIRGQDKSFSCYWPIPPFRSTRIIDFRITALRQTAARHPVESPIVVHGQLRMFIVLDSAHL